MDIGSIFTNSVTVFEQTCFV